MSLPSKVTQGVIVVVCVTGFYLGLRSTRSVPNESPITLTAPLGESLQRTQNDLSLVQTWYADLEAAARDNDKEALALLRKGQLANLTRTQLDELVRRMDAETDSYLRTRMVEAIAERWAELDPEAALSFVIERVQKGRQQKAFTTMLKTVAKTDGNKAYELLLSSEAANSKAVWSLGESAFEIFREWKKTSPEAAFEALKEGRIHKNSADAALYAVCRAESAAERQQVLRNVSHLEEGDLKRKAWGKVVYSWAKTAPLEEVVGWMDGKEFDADTVATMEREIASRKAKDNPSEMAKWLVERASPESLPEHMETAVQTWAHAQPNACAEWLHTMELGPQTDRAVAAFSYATTEHDVESAFTWAQQIHDPELLERTVGDVAARMFRYDPESLTQALASSDLDTDVKARVLERVKQF